MTKEIGAVGKINEEEIRSACDSILDSNDFLKAHRMRRLLRFLVEQALTGDRINTSEYVIGIKVFDRSPADHVSEDPIVRVQVGRLRKRLASYYMKRPDYGGIEISIPVGQYMPIFRRATPPSPPPSRDGCLVIQPIRHIAECGEGQAFATGLYEELLHHLFASFGDICMPTALSPMCASDVNGTADNIHRVIPRHLIEGSVRIDAERIRASIRLVDYSLQRIAWVGHFDRSVQFGIREQEELAMSICSALKEVVPNQENPDFSLHSNNIWRKSAARDVQNDPE